MGDKVQTRLTFLLLAVLLLVPAVFLSARKEKKTGKADDGQDIVRLIKATSLEQFELYGQQHRKALNATFLHNGTYLVSDTAVWNVDGKTITARGHVKVTQGDTRLTSEKLDYLIDDNLAIFSGVLVQLENKKKNILRTQHLNYDTRDSLAVFSEGASMRDADGQIIESIDGTYDSKSKIFTFSRDVEMFTDSVFVKTAYLVYYSDLEKADFITPIDFWRGDNMLSSRSGWYQRDEGTFFFTKFVHGMNPERELWADSMYVFQATDEILLQGNIQIRDSVRNVITMGDWMLYQDTISTVTLRKNAAIALISDDSGQRDTAYMGADKIVYSTINKDKIPEYIGKKAESRLSGMNVDPVKEYREKAAQAAAEAAAKAAEEKEAREHGYSKSMPGKDRGLEQLPEGGRKGPGDKNPNPEEEAPQQGEATAPADSLTAAPQDSLALAPVDSSKVGFMYASGKVRLFRSDLQVLCDSLEFTDLDSLVRLYGDPYVWNDINRQYTSDSVYVQIRNSRMEKANLMSNAYIITQEDSLLFDQIKSAEVMAYFDTTSALKRFDALGDAVALFYLEENGRIATANKVQSKMLSATLKDGNVQRIFYFDSPKNDAFPVVQLPSEEKKMKGFNWSPQLRPAGREDIVSAPFKESQKSEYANHPKPSFTQTRFYFKGYIERIYEEIDMRKKGIPVPSDIEKAKAKEKARAEAKAKEGIAGQAGNDDAVPGGAVVADSLAAPLSQADSLSVPSSQADSLTVPPSPDVSRKPKAGNPKADKPLNPQAPADSLSSQSDSLSVQPDSLVRDSVVLSPKEIAKKEREEKLRQKREAAELALALKIAERDARWARLDSLDALKAAAKNAKKLEKKRAWTRKQVIRQRKAEEKDRRRLEKYIAQYQRKKEIDERKKKPAAEEQ
ncbi:MAG: hypothetical protein J5764_01950 [Bacteroidales bacterium]|nr:hypothetical protein [Bacteroidales bacterium]